MDSFDLIAAPVHQRRKIGVVWSGLLILGFFSLVCTGAALLSLRINPKTSLGLALPPTLQAMVTLPSATPVPVITSTDSATATREPARTQIPTRTATPTATPQPPTATIIEVSPTATYTRNFELQSGNPLALPNIGHPESGCNWTGIAGQAIGVEGAPIVGLLVKLIGVFDDQTFDLLTLTGTATQYGLGGYEFTLGDHPVDSSGTLRLQLYDQAMVPLSSRIRFDTYEDCERNLILINFVQSR